MLDFCLIPFLLTFYLYTLKLLGVCLIFLSFLFKKKKVFRLGPEKLLLSKVKPFWGLYLMTPHGLWGLSALTDWNTNYSQPSVNSGNCSACCFPVVLSSVPGSLVSWMHRSLSSCSLKDLPLFLSVQLSTLWYSTLQILADLASLSFDLCLLQSASLWCSV